MRSNRDNFLRAALRLAQAGTLMLALMAVPADAASEATVFVRSLAVLTDADQGAPLATLSPATPLTPLESRNGRLHVTVGGWARAGAAKYLFKAPGLRIVMAALSDAGAARATSGVTETDEYGVAWIDARLDGWIAAQDVTPDLDDVWAAASDIYFSHCNRCHQLRSPKRFLANQWPQVLKIMTVRAGLDEKQKALVTMLFQYHARDQQLEDAFTAKLTAVPADPAAAPKPLTP
jgi:hypothetical protein